MLSQGHRLMLEVSQIVKCGIHSGYPSCCISYYVSLGDNQASKVGAINGYVPCPYCRKTGNIVTPKSCDCYSDKYVTLGEIDTDGEYKGDPEWEASIRDLARRMAE